MTRSTGTPQPIPYQGSKRKIAPTILENFPADISRLVEPFAGSAALSIAAASRIRAARFWINDSNSPLMDLWQEIINRPEYLADRYTRLWNDQLGRENDFYIMVRSRFNEQHDPADFLYLLARCVKAAVRYNSKGEFNNSPDNRRKGAKPLEMRWRITRASALFKGRTRLTSWDYKKVLKNCTAGDLVYMDPPYQGVSGQFNQRYLPKVDHDEFCIELEKLYQRGVMFAVSYDGRTGTKTYGPALSDALNLTHLEICAGRSTQATLLGRSDVTYESLYLSPALMSAAGKLTLNSNPVQLTLDEHLKLA